MDWLLIVSVVFVGSVLFLLLRIPGRGSLLVDAFLIPVAAVVILTVAIFALIWGLQPNTGRTVSLGGFEFSSVALRATSRNVGVGIITGMVAGAAIAAAQRWHDFEGKANWTDILKRDFEKTGLHVVESDGGGFFVVNDEKLQELQELEKKLREPPDPDD